jgi:hypothetical protein
MTPHGILVALSVLVGIIAAGLVWFGWAFTRNLGAAVNVSLEKKRAKAAEAERLQREEIEAQVREQQRAQKQG